MTDKNYGADVATKKEQIEGTWSIDGDEYDLLTEDTTKQTLNIIEQYMEVAQSLEEGDVPEGAAEDLPNFPWEDDDSEKDFIESILDAKLIKPEIDVQDAPIRKLRALFEGCFETWSEGKRVKNAKEEMPLDKGNR